jgi:glyoxylase-like metal-dependent hydrolase (beta-lactamase superfamily II)
VQPKVEPFFHKQSCTWSYVVSDPATKTAVVVDPALDYDWRSGRTGTESAEHLRDYCVQHGLRVEWILETHAHADHISAAPYLKSELGGKIGIGEGIRAVQATFKRIFNLGDEFHPDGSQFDRLFVDGEHFEVGTIRAKVIATPGHTSDSVSYLVGDSLFIGDTIFMPDSGSARCDFPGGDAALLYRSVQKLYALPPETRVFVCHDYSPGGREPRHETTVAEQKASNTHIRDGVSEAEFVAMRSARDATLDVPNLIIPSVQVNIRGGRPPPPESNGIVYLKVPVDTIGRPLHPKR